MDYRFGLLSDLTSSPLTIFASRTSKSWGDFICDRPSVSELPTGSAFGAPSAVAGSCHSVGTSRGAFSRPRRVRERLRTAKVRSPREGSGGDPSPAPEPDPFLARVA